MLAFDKPVVRSDDSSEGGEENGISSHEGQERAGRAQDLPWDDDPASDDSCYDAAALDIDISWEKHCQVVRSGNRVCCNVGAYLSDIP